MPSDVRSQRMRSGTSVRFSSSMGRRAGFPLGLEAMADFGPMPLVAVEHHAPLGARS